MTTAFLRMLVAASLMIAATVQAQQPLTRNGDWWQKLPTQEVKWGYLVGVFDGMGLGHRLSWWPLEKDEKHSECVPAVIDAFRGQVRAYLATLDNQKLASELDRFYLEPKNQSIKVADAVWILANQLAGKPPAEIEAMIADYRSR